MNFRDFYKNGKFRHSIEIFPPKTETGLTQLYQTLNELDKLNPAFISVTYGAMGSTRHLTESLAIKIKKDLNCHTAFHFTCVGSTRDDIKNYISHLEKEGLDLVVALRGDPPMGETEFVPPVGGFKYANELVGYLKKISNLSIAVAGYPEGHVESKNLKDDLKHLKLKVDAGADIIITQLFYNNDDFYRFKEQAVNSGIHIPIIAGIMPIINLKQIERIAGMCGAKIPLKLHSKLENCNHDANAMQEVGIEHAINQCVDLKNNKVDGIHFYCLNKSDSIKKVIENI